MKFAISTTKSKIAEGENLIRNNDGVCRSDGSFEVQGVEGSYYFNEDEKVLTINVTDKPWLASWDMIEKKIKEFFA